MSCYHLGGEVGADINRRGRWSSNGGGGGRGSIADKRKNLTRFMMHNNMTVSRVELVAEKAASNRGGSAPATSPQEGWVGQFYDSEEAGGGRGGRQGRLNHGGSCILREEGGVCQGKEGARLYIQGPNIN